MLTPTVAQGLRCRLVVGPANNQLATDDVADILHSRGVVWVPDVLASAGGIVHAINIEQHGLTNEQVVPRIAAIGDTIARVLAEARQSSLNPLAVARRQAYQRICRAAGANQSSSRPVPSGVW